MTAKPPFTLMRATTEDITELVDLQYRCFPEFVRVNFMGCYSPDDLPRICDYYAKSLREDPADVWTKVTDTSTGKIIAASNWKVFPGKPNHGEAEQPPSWLREEDRERSARIYATFNTIRANAMPGPHVHLHICFTDPDYRRQGAGGMMLQWGCDVADQLFVPAWIEASKEGNFLYKAYGFYDVETLEGELEGTCMRRDAKSTAVEGGKSKPL